MKKTLKDSLKAALLACLAAVAVSSAQAQQSLTGTFTSSSADLLAGFTIGSGNDLVLNLGTYSSLADGQYWDITALLGSTPSVLNNLANVQFGVIGTGSGFEYSTSAGTPAK